MLNALQILNPEIARQLILKSLVLSDLEIFRPVFEAGISVAAKAAGSRHPVAKTLAIPSVTKA
jgi:hypothetical protein